MRIERIVTATDLGPCARLAAERGALLACQHHAQLDLLHIVATSQLQWLCSRVSDATSMEQQVCDAAQKEMGQLADTLATAHGVNPGIHVAAGRVLQELLLRLTAAGPDLLLVGAHGRSGLVGRLLGSTPERLLSRTTLPLLVVKQEPKHTYRRVLVPVDFSAYSMRALEAAAVVAPGADIIVLHAYQAPFEGNLWYAGVKPLDIERYRMAARQEAQEKLQALLAEGFLGAEGSRSSVMHGEARSIILNQEKKLGCDLIVIGKHGQENLEDLLLGSVTRHVLSESRADVLVVR